MTDRQCCECGGCQDCFESNANTPCCRLAPGDMLVLKINRPAWTRPVALNYSVGAGTECPLPVGSTRLEGTVSYDAAEPILVMYQPFAASSTTGNGLWFADNGSFGCEGGTDANNLWELWPPLCPQQISVGGTPKPACCNNTCLCSSTSSLRVNIGPSDNYISTNWVCSNSDSSASNNRNLTQFQVDVINGNAANRLITNYSNCSACGGTPINATAICNYSGFEWLQGIHNDSVNATARYRHFYWDGSAVIDAGLKPLAHTLVSVYHKERWYKRCEAYDGGLISEECEQVTNWGCRVPEYWVYGCAGVPIFSWEIYEMLNAGKITQAEHDWFFQSQYENKPLGYNATGKSLIKKLETTHWYHADGSGVAILQTKDFRGTTLPGETSAVPASQTRLVRKDLARYTLVRGNYVRTVVTHQFFHARPGGWSHVCQAPPKVCGTGACSGDLYAGAEIEQLAPQITRATGCRPSGGNCDYDIWENQNGTAFTTGQGCFSASPYPQCNTCTPTATYSGCSACGGCDDCPPPPQSQCGGATPFVCQQDVYRASCSSIHFTFVGYWDDQTGDFDNEACVIQNHAYLFAVNENCEPLNDSGNRSCVSRDCPPGPVTQVPRHKEHLISLLRSRDTLCNCTDTNNLCNGARYQLGDSATNPSWTCEGVIAKQASGTNRDPGSFMKGPYTSDGCGQHLCQDGKNFPIGACCVSDGTTTECIDAVTEAQCTKCGARPGYSSVWKGSNSCCLDTDLCG